MYNRKRTIQLICGVGLILLFSFLGSWMLITGCSYTLSFVSLVIILFITLFIIRLITHLDQQLTYFFDALRSQDYTNRYPEKETDPFLARLFDDMNRITSLLNQQKKEIEEKQLYYEGILKVLMHELRNSITPLSALSTELSEHSDQYNPEEIKSQLELIRHQAAGLNKFLSSYHQLTHLPEPVLEEINLSELFIRLQKLLAPLPDSDKVRYYIPENLFLRADSHLLLLAFVNVINNACQAIKELPESFVVVKVIREKEKISVLVSDNGPGIPPGLLTTVFIPFYSTKKEGSGIGLSVAARVVAMHGGTLQLHSKPGENTTFTFQFPI